ncbi:MAG TPA: nucleotide sugar dehydrogenase [Chloroflexota bacterium]|nr:nucleotide sugar dehydrogenase [Chloroflexota bacterium]
MLADRLRARSAHIAVLGLGYAGLPMATELAQAGYLVTGLDTDPERVRLISAGQSPVSDVPASAIAPLVERGRLRATEDFAVLAEVDGAIICVPTPLTPERRPDLRFVESAARSIAAHLHPDTLVVLQSTCAPGTTRRVVLPLLEASGLRVGEEFFVAFAPERIDPGNTRYTVRNTPKLVGGITPRCTELAALLFAPVVEQVVPVSSPEVAELSKLVENTFRFINISFINEVALLCDRLGISIWEVIEAASTKPFAFMPHYPGPGVGGHCIPIVPFYLEAVAREHGMVAELIEVAGRINDTMPVFVVGKLERLLAERGKRLAEARVLLLGMAYKPDVNDTRESPSLRVLERLLACGAQVGYHDPYVPYVRCGGRLLHSLGMEELVTQRFDCAVLLTAHSAVDYEAIGRQVGFVFDTRNALPALQSAPVLRF